MALARARKTCCSRMMDVTTAMAGACSDPSVESPTGRSPPRWGRRPAVVVRAQRHANPSPITGPLPACGGRPPGLPSRRDLGDACRRHRAAAAPVPSTDTLIRRPHAGACEAMSAVNRQPSPRDSGRQGSRLTWLPSSREGRSRIADGRGWCVEWAWALHRRRADPAGSPDRALARRVERLERPPTKPAPGPLLAAAM